MKPIQGQNSIEQGAADKAKIIQLRPINQTRIPTDLDIYRTDHIQLATLLVIDQLLDDHFR